MLKINSNSRTIIVRSTENEGWVLITLVLLLFSCCPVPSNRVLEYKTLWMPL